MRDSATRRETCPAGHAGLSGRRAAGSPQSGQRPDARYSSPAMAPPTSFDLKHRSRTLTEGPARAAARSYLKGIGYDEEALTNR